MQTVSVTRQENTRSASTDNSRPRGLRVATNLRAGLKGIVTLDT